MKRGHVIALMLIAILLASVVFAPVPGDTRWIRTLHNSAHAPIFGCVSLLMLWLCRSQPRLQPLGVGAQYVLALAVAFGLGFITEVLQIPAGRDASVEDLVHDVIGALGFLGVFAAFDARIRALPQSAPIRFAAAVVAVVSLGIAAAPVTRSAIEYRQRDARFPVLIDVSRSYERYFVRPQSSQFSPVEMPAAWARAADEQAMRVRLLDGPYPGMNFIEPVPDWSGYTTLAVDLTNPTPMNLQLVLRVHDAAHDNQPDDRFSTRFELPAGTRQIVRVPLQDVAAGPRTRRLDLRRVTGLIIFRTEESPPAGELYLSRAWLE